MDHAKTDQEATSLQYEAPRLVASLDSLDLISDADGRGVLIACGSTIACP